MKWKQLPLAVRIPIWLVVIATGLMVVAAMVFTVFWLTLKSPKEWVNEVVPAIGARVDDTEWIAKRLEPLGGDDYFDNEIVKLPNGDWIIYRQSCSHLSSDFRLRDMFVGRGSDGKWYWSTNHFCTGMNVLYMDLPSPPSLEAFVYIYRLHEIEEPTRLADVAWNPYKREFPEYDWPPKQRR